MDERIGDVETTVEIHGEKIKNLEEFKEIHEKKHEPRDEQHTQNTLKIHYIEKIFLSILGIMGSAVIIALLQLVINK